MVVRQWLVPCWIARETDRSDVYRLWLSQPSFISSGFSSGEGGSFTLSLSPSLPLSVSLSLGPGIVSLQYGTREDAN